MLARLKKIAKVLLGTTAVLAIGATIHDYTLHKTPETNPIPLPREARETFNCTVPWISKALGFPVTNFVSEQVGSQSYRLNLEKPTLQDGPSSVFVKYFVRLRYEHIFLRIAFLFMATREMAGRKEAYFYKTLHEPFRKQGINTPRPIYVAVEDYGDRSILFNILGFITRFRGVIILQDIQNVKKLTSNIEEIPEEYAIFGAKKLAQLHALNWTKNNNAVYPSLPSYTPYNYRFCFDMDKKYFTVGFPTKDTLTDRLKELYTDETQKGFFDDPQIKDALYAYSELYPNLKKYYSNSNATSGPLFQQTTFLHGNYLMENLLYVTEPNAKTSEEDIKDIIITDWEDYGYGHPSTEFAYYMSYLIPNPELDGELMKIYYEELTKTIPKTLYPWKVFEREVDIRTIELVGTSLGSIRNKEAIHNLVETEFGPLEDNDFFFGKHYLFQEDCQVCSGYGKMAKRGPY